MLKRLTAMLLCVLMLAAFPMAVCAENEDTMSTFEKTYSLHMNALQGYIRATPDTAAFWEYPILKAGETYKEGVLTIRNDSSITATIKLDSVLLPYGNISKLEYLDHLMLTVTDQASGEILFDNTYTHINDPEGGLKLVFNKMAPGEEHSYAIKLRCLYAYGGDPNTNASQLTWRFTAAGETTILQQSGGLPSWMWIVIITFAVMIVVLIVIMVVRAILTASKKRKAINEENTH